MLEAYVIAEVAAILRDGYYHLHGKGLSAEVERDINKLAHYLLPNLDNYFAHRLGVEELKASVDFHKRELEKLGSDKASNDKDYLELSGKYNVALDTLKVYQATNDLLLQKLVEIASGNIKGVN